jgi:hypothetical protein
MNEYSSGSVEERSRRLFDASVDQLDMRVRSRLNQARQAALDVARSKRSGFLRFPAWTSAAGVTAVGLLGAAIWFGSPLMHPTSVPHPASIAADAQNLEDLDIVATSEGNSGDAIDMLQDDIDFYQWAADKTANTANTAPGTVG